MCCCNTNCGIGLCLCRLDDLAGLLGFLFGGFLLCDGLLDLFFVDPVVDKRLGLKLGKGGEVRVLSVLLEHELLHDQVGEADVDGSSNGVGGEEQDMLEHGLEVGHARGVVERVRDRVEEIIGIIVVDATAVVLFRKRFLIALGLLNKDPELTLENVALGLVFEVLL